MENQQPKDAGAKTVNLDNIPINSTKKALNKPLNIIVEGFLYCQNLRHRGCILCLMNSTTQTPKTSV